MSLKTLLKICIFLLIFMIEARLRSRPVGSTSADFQVLIKLGFWCLAFSIGAYYYRYWIDKLLRIDNFFLVPLFALIFASCAWAPSLPYSAGAAFTVLALIVLMFAASRLMDEKTILLTLLTSITILSIVSIILYFALPSYARAWEWQGSRRVLGHRLSGIAGPNGIGFLTCTAIMIAIFINRYGVRRNWMLYAAAGANFIALIMSNSRTPLLAMLIGLGVASLVQVTPSRIVAGCLGIAIILIGALTIDFTPLLTLVSRSGNIEEIATGTGRVYIWHVVGELIAMRPFHGYGYASSSFIIPGFNQEIGDAPPHSHNLYLQLVFSVGYFGLILFALMIAAKLYYSFRSRDGFKLALITFMLIHGITESSIFQGTVQNAVIVWAMIMALDYKGPRRTAQQQQTTLPSATPTA